MFPATQSTPLQQVEAAAARQYRRQQLEKSWASDRRAQKIKPAGGSFVNLGRQRLNPGGLTIDQIRHLVAVAKATGGAIGAEPTSIAQMQNMNA